jgi:hypothetical protein
MRKIALTLTVTSFLFCFAESLSSAFAETNAALPLIGIRINGGDKYTNKRDVEVEIKSLKTDQSLLQSMKIGFSPDLSDASWQTYTEIPQQMRLQGGDGEKSIYVQLQDKAGNASPIEHNKIIFDTTAPTDGKMIINRGAKYLNDKLGRVLLNLKAESASEVFISNSPQFTSGTWETYKESAKWVVDVGNGDGLKTVYAKFRDEAGNESPAIQASIILDTTAPSDGTLVINNGERITRSRKLRLLVKSKESTKVRIVSRGIGKNFDFTPESNGRLEVLWETDSLQGNKSVKAYFMDEARNTTKVPAEATVLLKTKPPARPLVMIDQGKKFTNSKAGTVHVSIATKENPNQLMMLISNSSNFEGSDARPFVRIIDGWKLDTETDGLKKVYVRLIDEAGNISEVSSAEIFLDRSPPVVNSFTINEDCQWCISLSVVLYSDVDDAYEAKYSNNPNTLRNISWEKYVPQRPDWMLMPNDGPKAVYAIFRDQAGNISELTSARINVDMTPPQGKLQINQGSRVTNHPDGMVTLSIIADEDVVGMQITNVPNFDEAKLQPLVKKIESWQLEDQLEGLKTVFCRLQDRAGNYSKVLTASILLDRTPPSGCELVINNHEPYVRNARKSVPLSLRAEGADAMMISNNEQMEGAKWVAFKTAVAWTLDGPEGVHHVYVKFRDKAGNESGIISKSIQSDFSPPKIKEFAINDGEEFCSDPQGFVDLTFDVEDATSMAISNSQLKDTSAINQLWEPYKASKKWQLEGEDGLKIVYGRFKDEASNVTLEYYDKIVLDRIPPEDARISINNGAKWLNNKALKADLSLYAKGAYEILLSNSSNFSQSTWEPYIELRKDWQISSGPEASVYAKFRDKAGNESKPVSASILVDLEAPKNPKLTIDDNAKYVQNKERKILFTLGAEGATGMRIGINQDFRNSRWEPYVTSKELILTTADGEKTFFGQFSDDAGNISEVVTATIILDTTPPKIEDFAIDGGKEWTNDAEKKVHLNINASGAFEMQISDNPDFAGARWEPFLPEVSGYVLPGEDGEKVLFLKLRDEAGNISRTAATKINLKRSF